MEVKGISEKEIDTVTGSEKGFAIVTYRMRLYDRHHNWLMITKQIYNQVVWHYYQILTEELSLLEQSNFLLLRLLEKMTIGTKEMKERGEEPAWKLENLPKIPLYFRRAAINAAIGLARSGKGNEKGKGFPQAAQVNCSPVFYKGMYREFQQDSIQIKVYNGKKWVWMVFPYVGNRIPKEGAVLSPALKIEKDAAYLHVPVRIQVQDIRTVKERLQEEKAICAVAFPDSDCLAVCVILEKNGRVINNYFIHRGKERDVQRQRVQKRLEKSKKSRQSGKQKKQAFENRSCYRKLKQINQYYAHKVSREILEYCKKNQIKMIVVPDYENSIPFWEFSYLHSRVLVNRFYHWQGRAIIQLLKYKAFREGILVTTVRPYHISDSCSECGSKIRRYNEGHKASQNYYGGKLFICPNGHRGNVAWNTAKNIGRYFLRRY